MTAACGVWLAREFLHRRADVAAGWMSPTGLGVPGGHRFQLPAPCTHDVADCPPLASLLGKTFNQPQQPA